MNNLERRFYNEPTTRSIPVGYSSTMKDIFRKILKDIHEENPYATISDILDEEDTDGEEGNVDEF